MKLLGTLFLAMICFTLACSTSDKKGDTKTTADNQKAQVSKTSKKMKRESVARARGAGVSNNLDGVPKNATVCTGGPKSNRDERAVWKENKNPGCVVLYLKFGETNEVANANNDTSHCDEIVERIKGKLSAAGFECEG